MLKVLSLFSGIGAFEKALERQGIEYQLVNYCEIDKYASKAYSLIHNVSEQMNLGDITKINIESLNEDIDLLTHGSPCQDYSVAGNQAGGDKGSNTRSSLMWNTVDIVKHVRPKIVLWENVKNLLGKKHRHNFDSYIQIMDELGYNSYYQVLNAKDYGIPQNRERVYTISIRKDIDSGDFKFPEPFELKLRLKDMLENTVEEKYFLSDQFLKGLKKHNQNHHKKGTGFIWKPKTGEETANCLRANAALCPTDNTVIVASRGRYDENGNVEQYIEPNDKGLCNTLTTVQKDNLVLEPKLIQVGQIYGTEREPNPQAGRVYDVNGLSPTMDSCSGGNRMPKVVVQERLTGAYGRNFGSKGKLQDIEGSCDTLLSAMGCGGGNVPIVKEQENTAKTIREEPLEREGWHRNAKEVLNTNGICRTLSTQSNNLATKIKEQKSLRIRKLTPRECFRLMGFDDSDFDKVEGKLSNSQLYKMAGNSIVVNVLEEIYKQLFKAIKL